MTLLEALQRRHKIILIIKYQDKGFLNPALSKYRASALEDVNSIINKFLNNGNDKQTKKTGNREISMDREFNTQRSGDSTWSMGFTSKLKGEVINRRKLCRW